MYVCIYIYIYIDIYDIPLTFDALTIRNSNLPKSTALCLTKPDNSNNGNSNSKHTITTIQML